MAESYFELLTGQQGLPAVSHDPLDELRRLRRELALRLQTVRLVPEETAKPPETVLPKMEPASFETVINNAEDIKKTLTIWQRTRSRTKTARDALFRGSRTFRHEKRVAPVIAQYLTAPQEGALEKVNAGLMALGLVGVIFGVLSLFRGLESDFSFGSLVCASGAAIVAIGLGGRLLVARSEMP